jgi:GT2 family glycosyltransferase
MDVSIIIVSYNTKALLKQCLQSVFEKTQDITFEIIVVDNSSHDGSPQMVQDEFPNVTLVENENKGFGHANNVGAKYANGKYLFLLNPDTVLLNNAVKILFDFIDSHPKAGICGGNLFDETGQPAVSHSMYFPGVAEELDSLFFAMGITRLWHGRNIEFNHTYYARKVCFIVGADLMIKTALFQQIQGFDCDFFMYAEETELTFRVKKMGYEVYNIPQSKIIHLGGRSTDNEKQIELRMNGIKMYHKKTKSAFIAWVCNSIISVTILSRLFLFKIIGKTEKYNKRRLMFKYFVTTQVPFRYLKKGKTNNKQNESFR